MLAEIQQTAQWIKERVAVLPRTAIVLGTGLGRLAAEIEVEQEFPYADIPHFPVSTVEGHSGRLLFGRLGGKEIMALEGRFHFYEGYDMKQVTFPVRVMHELGIRTLFVSNAAGGVNPDFDKTRDIHIHFPEGAVPKDGPSAGVAITTAVVSALTGARVRSDVAMTGEVTLRGRVLAIGGLKEKTMAAKRNGIRTVIIPRDNQQDLAEIDPVVRDALRFVPAETVDTVLAEALLPREIADGREPAPEKSDGGEIVTAFVPPEATVKEYPLHQ